MSSLVCPRCRRGPLKWDAPAESDYISALDYRPMTCQTCRARFTGMKEWWKLSYPELYHRVYPDDVNNAE